MATILLTGANGSVTGAAIRALQGQGHKLVGLVRDPAKAKGLDGVELRTGDLSKLRTVEDAFTGVDVAFILTPAGPMAPYLSSNALWAARRAKVKHVVRLSAIGAAHDAPTLNSRLHALSDGEVANGGIPYTILKPHFFMQNLMMAIGSIKEQGAMYFALGEGRIPMIDVRDVGAVAAKVLADPSAHVNKTYSLTGPGNTLGEAAAALSSATGKAIKYVPIPTAQMMEALTARGADDYGQVAIRDYFTAYASGWMGSPTSTVKDLTGKEPRSIADFARDFAGAFGAK